MKRYALMIVALVGLCFSTGSARADWGCLRYGGWQPWWNVAGKCSHRCRTPEEKRLERFWHDYYDALRKYYANLDRLDWVAYYKNHGSPVGGGCYGPQGGQGCGPMNGGMCGPMNGGYCPRINYAPVFVTPQVIGGLPGCDHSPEGAPGCGQPGPN